MARPTEGHARGMVDTHEAAAILGCDTSTIRELARAGAIPVKDRVGVAKLFYRVDVERLADYVNGRPEDPNLCPLCRAPFGADVAVWDPEAPGRPPPPYDIPGHDVCEVVALKVRVCATCDLEAAIQQRYAERRATNPKESP